MFPLFHHTGVLICIVGKFSNIQPAFSSSAISWQSAVKAISLISIFHRRNNSIAYSD